MRRDFQFSGVSVMRCSAVDDTFEVQKDLLRFQFLNAVSDKNSAVAEMGDRLATIDMGRKEGGCYALSGGAGPHLTQCGLGRDQPPYQVAS